MLKKNKLEKVIGYEAYQIGKNYTPAGPVIEGVEKYDEIKEKGVENYWKEEVKKPSETEKHCKGKSWQYLTKQDIERGLAERIKKLINTGASGNQDEIKKLLERERRLVKPLK